MGFLDGLPQIVQQPDRRRTVPAKVVNYPKLLCPACGRDKIKVQRSEPIAPGDAIRQRYHLCESCGWTFQSVEKLQT